MLPLTLDTWAANWHDLLHSTLCSPKFGEETELHIHIIKQPEASHYSSSSRGRQVRIAALHPGYHTVVPPTSPITQLQSTSRSPFPWYQTSWRIQDHPPLSQLLYFQIMHRKSCDVLRISISKVCPPNPNPSYQRMLYPPAPC